MNQNYYRIVDEDVTDIANSDLPWEKLKNKTVLITGANGYLPSYMVFTLLKRNDLYQDGIHVVALCRNEEKAKDRFAPMVRRDDLEFLIQDVCDPIQYEGNVDVVVHAASPSGPQVWSKNLVETMKANTVGLFNLLEFSHKRKVEEFLFFSSSAVYGDNKTTFQLQENDFGYSNCMETRFTYCEAKRAGEALCAAYYTQYGLPVKIIRPSIIFGPGISTNAGTAIGDFLFDIYKGQDILIKSDGKAVRAYLYLKDAAAGFLTVLLCGENGATYNIGSEKNVYSITELAELICNNISKNTRYRMVNKNESKSFSTGINRVVVSASHLKTLGWDERTSMLEAIKRTMETLEMGFETYDE